MKLLLSGGSLYLDNTFFCFAEVGHGRTYLPAGQYSVGTEFSTAHGLDLPTVAGLGWIGADPECDIVLGRVRGRDALVPCALSLNRLLKRIAWCEFTASPVTLEVAHHD